MKPSCDLQEAAAAIAGETRQSDAHPDLMHRDVCTANALRRTHRVSPQQDVATAVAQSAAVVPACKEDLPRSPFEDRPGLGEALTIDRKHPLGAIRKRPVEFTSGWASHLRSANNVSGLKGSVPIKIQSKFIDPSLNVTFNLFVCLSLHSTCRRCAETGRNGLVDIFS